jgi:hypothetical protein
MYTSYSTLAGVCLHVQLLANDQLDIECCAHTANESTQCQAVACSRYSGVVMNRQCAIDSVFVAL